MFKLTVGLSKCDFQGDGGAPLVCRKEGITYLVGNAYDITEDCNPANPSLFVKTYTSKTFILHEVIYRNRPQNM